MTENNSTTDARNQRTVTRRDAIKGGVLIGGVTVLGPNVSVLVGATNSGEVEITTTAETPGGTSVTVHAYEDVDGDGEAENEDSITISGGENTYGLSSLEGTEDDEYTYWFEIELEGDGEETPVYESLELVLPEFAAEPTTSEDFDDDEWYGKPDHVTLEYDLETLQTYQPRLVMDDGTRRRFKGLYGYVARSDEYEYDVACYWGQLTHQDGLPVIRADSHLGDHEPCYVFFDSDTGEVETVIYTAYHWYAGQVSPGDSQATFVQDRHDEYETHIVLDVIAPWHHYSVDTDRSGAFVTVDDWLSVREMWADNGFFEPAEPGVIEDPDMMRQRSGWWEDGTMDARFADVFVTLGDLLGWFGGDEADEHRGL